MAFVGIDVSKDKLDVLWLRQNTPLKVKTRVFRNHRPLLKEVAEWLLKQTEEAPENIHVVLEATSIYHENLSHALHEAGFIVYVANPARVKDFARSEGALNKTDKKDSLVLALYGQEKRSEEHTSELQSRPHLVCRLLLEKKKNKVTTKSLLV